MTMRMTCRERTHMALDLKTLADQLRPNQEERLDALAQYLRALPITTTSHWECFTCMLEDLAVLREQLLGPRPPATTSPAPAAEVDWRAL